MDGRTAEPALPRRTDDAAAGHGFCAGVRRHGAGRPQRTLRAPALTPRRHAGIVGGAAVDGLFAGHQTHRRPLPCRIHHPQGILLRAADHPAGIRFPAFFDHFRGVGPPRRVGQPAVPGDRSLDALLCPVERRDAQAGSRAHDQLHLFQPVGDDHHGGGLHRRPEHFAYYFTSSNSTSSG